MSFPDLSFFESCPESISKFSPAEYRAYLLMLSFLIKLKFFGLSSTITSCLFFQLGSHLGKAFGETFYEKEDDKVVCRMAGEMLGSFSGVVALRFFKAYMRNRVLEQDNSSPATEHVNTLSINKGFHD